MDLSNVLGTIGDALLTANGRQAIYGPRQQQRKIGQALANYLGNLEPGLADIMTADPEAGLQLYKMQHPEPAEVPAALREFQAYAGMPDAQRQQYERFLQLTHPGMMSPVTLGPGDTIEQPPDTGSVPHVTDQATYDAVPPGATYVTPDGKVRQKPGGQTASPSGNFLDAVTSQNESGNRDFTATGAPVTSSKGARFAMQVMPSTARDPGFGLRPANPNDAADMNRLGREYRAKMQAKYGGDLAKMWAAYNMGPNGLDRALSAHGENWFDHVPQETRDYVARNLVSLGRQ